MCKVDCCRICNYNRLIEIFLLDVLRITCIQPFHGLDYLFNDSGETDIQNLAVIYTHMSNAAVEVVAYRKHSVCDAVLSLL